MPTRRRKSIKGAGLFGDLLGALKPLAGSVIRSGGDSLLSHFGLGLKRGSAQAHAKMAKVRSHIKSKGHLVKGSAEAKAHMAKLRAIKARKSGGSFVPY